MSTTDPTYEQSKQIAEDSRDSEWTRPSFGREMYLGRFRLDLIHPQPDMDADGVRDGEEFLARLRASSPNAWIRSRSSAPESSATT